jgi:hypothetical protein
MYNSVFFLSPMSISEKVSNSKKFTHASYGSNRGTARKRKQHSYTSKVETPSH